MELTPDIETIISGFLFGVCSSGIVFYKLAAMVQVKRALWKI